MSMTVPTIHEPPPQPADGQRRIEPKWLIAGAGALVLMLVVALVIVVWAANDDGRAKANEGGRVASGPRDGRGDATVELLTGATSVTVRAVDLGDTLYEVETPAGGRQVPLVEENGGVVHVELGDSGGRGTSAVEIRLSSAVRWTVRMVAGATRHTMDLSAGRVAAVDFVGGAGSVDLTLPRPSGTVTVRMTSGVGTWAVHVPADVPVQVLVGGGAGTVTLDGARQTGVSAGTTVTGDGWEAATDRYDLAADGGMSSFTLDRR